MRELSNFADFPLEGISLIEASAGTGKTYSIVRIYLRHVMERGRRAEQVVVASFTNAATDELRSRIQTGLADAQLAVETLAEGAEPTERLAELVTFVAGAVSAVELRDGIDSSSALRLVAARLRLAQLSIDTAPIATIDAICGRWSNEFALAAGTSLLPQELGDGRALLNQAIAREILRLQSAPEGTAEASLLHYVSAFRTGKPSLEDWLALLIRHGYAPDETTADAATGSWEDLRPRIVAFMEAPPKGIAKNQKEISGRLIKYGLLEQLDEAAQGLGSVSRDALEAAQAAARTKPRDWFTEKADPIDDVMALAAELQNHFRGLLGQHLAGPLLASYERVRAHLAELKRERDTTTFDDQTGRLCAALERDPDACRSVARRYPVTLVDEFQDSSPEQTRIFRAIYQRATDDTALVMIGDPKQAIYGFRGGDVYAYLEARQSAGDRQFFLPNSFRSTHRYITAINALFDESHQPFGPSSGGIAYRPVGTGLPWQADAAEVDEAPALRVLLAHQDPESKTAPNPPANKLMPDLVAELVTTHLQSDRAPERRLPVSRREGDQWIKRLPRPVDLAILVRTNPVAKAIYDRLAAQGYPVVSRTQASIFEADEAQELLRILDAGANPSDESLVRGAATTELFGFTLAQCEQLEHEPEELEALLDRFERYRHQWETRGVMTLLYARIAESGRRLLQRPGGTRAVTNWLHLAELCAVAEERHPTPGRLLRWLRRMVEDSRAREEDAGDQQLLRLETDEDAIQIVTIHRSKGLEYPVTILADPWRAIYRDKPEKLADLDRGPFPYHDAAGRPAISLAESARPEHAQQRFEEELEEDLRLAYVGLTRAVYESSIIWGRTFRAKMWESGFQWLVCDPDSRSMDGTQPPAANPMVRLEQLAQAHPGTFAFDEQTPAFKLPRWRSPEAARDQEALAAARLGDLPGDFWAVTSFSAIKRGAATDDNALEIVDTDEMTARDPDARQPQATAVDDTPAFLAGSGRNFGNAFHGVMEDALPAWPVDEAAGQALAQEHLGRFGVGAPAAISDAAWQQARHVLEAPLGAHEGQPVRLVDLDPAARIAEMEFDIRLQRQEPEVIANVLADFGYQHAALLLRQRQRPLEGLLHGFIDLTFRWEGRYYVLDYKTNWLGDRIGDYGFAAMDEAMAASAYDLQYLFYSLAVDRWLRGLDPDYRYADHFGGGYYLFIRGMHTAGSEGVWFDRPSEALINALGDVLCGEALP